ncbi:MAG: class I SAM-dependent methyltransferase [Ignavibacteria bacterium]|nr:class I SAM-dependent methyltransferase [Ignavibacteria bacterium]
MTSKKEYWQELWTEGRTKWDVGYAAPSITEYIDQLKDKSIKILIPGAGNAYEAEYLLGSGFQNVFVLDIARKPLENLLSRAPTFPKRHLLNEDFFAHTGEYDLIIEHTFFIAIDPEKRAKYAEKIHSLLTHGGKLVGLFIEGETPDGEGPPHLSPREEYRKYFEELFDVKVFETAYNSIKPRARRELFVKFMKK